ncbi:MAG: DNA polymerase III subunit beta [Anaerolineaceae bacterium]|nr:MAG: DNA polymerase III subunit beta [Anaerolineaceae bacterium]
MKITVIQESLARGLSIVGKAVESRPTMPVLSNVLIQTEESRLRLSAVNMTLGLGITCWIGASVSESGSITLPSKTLMDLVSNLSPEKVTLTLDTNTLTLQLTCGGTKANIKGIDADEFPPVQIADGGGDLAVDGKVLKEMIQQTAFAAAGDDNRPILTGVYTLIEGDTLTMAAADGYRLAVRTAKLEQAFPERVEMVIPAKSLNEVARIISEEDSEVWITLPKERDIVMFHLKNVDVSSQLLEGKFPDFRAIIPRQYSTSTVMYTSDLLRACQRAEIFARDNAYSGYLYVTPPKGPSEPGEVKVASKSTERGDNEGVVDASVEGEALDISFNIKYLIEVLRVIHDERIVLESGGSAHPGVIRPENRDDFIHVIMPMSVTR